jgi:hypothetical protein
MAVQGGLCVKGCLDMESTSATAGHRTVDHVISRIEATWMTEGPLSGGDRVQ